MFNKFMQNTRMPVGLGGRIMVSMMNKSHEGISQWGFSHIHPKANSQVLDIGCGGGANIANWLSKCPDGIITGVDHSPVSVKKSIKMNKKAVKQNRCNILMANVTELPFDNESFDYITAFETVYFWPDIVDSFKEVLRVLKKGGAFMICNETDGTNDDARKWEQQIHGLKAYTVEELKEYLTKAGFTNIKTDIEQEKSWIFITAYK